MADFLAINVPKILFDLNVPIVMELTTPFRKEQNQEKMRQNL